MIILTEQELADRLKLTTRTLRNWRTSEPPLGPCHMGLGTDNKTIRYRLQDVEAWERGKVTGGAIPEPAKTTMQRAAGVFDMILRWKDVGEQPRSTIAAMRDELRAQLNTGA